MANTVITENVRANRRTLRNSARLADWVRYRIGGIGFWRASLRINFVNLNYQTMDSREIRRHMTFFLTDKSCATVEGAKQYLIGLRKSGMIDRSLTESRMLWFSLLLYKFRSENGINDEVWGAAKGFVLASLRQDADVEERARHFIQMFTDWKRDDRVSFLNEVVGYYLEVLHLKETIEETKEEATISEWRDSYVALIQTIRDAAGRMGFLAELDARVAEVHRVRHSLVENMMKRAYWDLVERDIREERYDTVLCQLIELKELLKEVIPERFHADLHDRFDIDDIQARLEARALDSGYLVQLCRWIMDTMKEWDSEEARPLYDREIQTWDHVVQEGSLEWPRFLRFSLELCTLLALDAKTRISVWRSVLRGTRRYSE